MYKALYALSVYENELRSLNMTEICFGSTILKTIWKRNRKGASISLHAKNARNPRYATGREFEIIFWPQFCNCLFDFRVSCCVLVLLDYFISGAHLSAKIIRRRYFFELGSLWTPPPLTGIQSTLTT